MICFNEDDARDLLAATGAYLNENDHVLDPEIRARPAIIPITDDEVHECERIKLLNERLASFLATEDPVS